MPTRYSPLEHPKRIIVCDENGVKRVQTLTLTPEFEETIAKEIGSKKIIDTWGMPIATTVDMTKNDFGESDTIALFMGEKIDPSFDEWDNSYFVTTEDLELQMVDFLVYQNLDGALANTIWVPSCRMTRFSFEYTVDGVASETWTFRGLAPRHYAGGARDAGVAIGAYADVDKFTVEGDVEHDTALIQVSVQGQVAYSNKVPDTITASYDDIDDTTTVTVTDATFKPTDRIRLIYYRTTPRDWDEISVEYDMEHVGRGMVFRGQAYPFFAPLDILGDDGTYGLWDEGLARESEKMLWVQRCTIDFTADSTDRFELGNMSAVSVRINYPPTVTVTAEVLASSLEDMARLSDLEDWWDNIVDPTDETAYRFKDEFIKNYNTLIVDVYRERADLPVSEMTLLKRIAVTGLAVTGHEDTQDIDADGRLTWTFAGRWMAISGTGEDPMDDTASVPDELYDV